MTGPPNFTSELVEMIFEQKKINADQSVANFILQLAPITLMIDKNIITIEEAAQRIEQLRDVSMKGQDRPTANRLIRITVDWLRSHEKPEASGWQPVVHEGGLSESQPDDQ